MLCAVMVMHPALFVPCLQEKMISGVTGEEMPCDIYIGVVYYQRLRHMVSDKFQVSVCVCVAGWDSGTA